MIRGVGPVYAKKLVRAFGDKVFDIIEATPDRLREVDGIGPVRAASILSAWAEQKARSAGRVIQHDSVGIGHGQNILRGYARAARQAARAAINRFATKSPASGSERPETPVASGFRALLRGHSRHGAWRAGDSRDVDQVRIVHAG
jgi:exodeoxyribonuclease V alpha subunit